jgi:ComF family protein
MSLFFPRYCRACRQALVKGEMMICTRCLLELPRSYYHLERENPFYNRLRGRIAVSEVITLFKFVKNSGVQRLLHALKYMNQPELGVELGRLYGQELLDAGYYGRFEVIIPVPLYKARLRQRRYNQSEEFGKGLAGVLGIPCEGQALKRIARTETQTRKSRLDRWLNVSQVFVVAQPEKIAGRHVLLVDDVVTTGATLEACGRVIIQAGCRELSMGCIAATV